MFGVTTVKKSFLEKVQFSMESLIDTNEFGPVYQGRQHRILIQWIVT
jgi:hypothetical protein